MQLYKWYIVSLFLIVQIVTGCGGGGGGGGTVPPVADTIAPTVNNFILPGTSASLTVPVTFSATDLVGVTGYLITENATAPAVSAVGWTATAPTTFTFSSGGSKTPYAWAKDAAGNISSGREATTVIPTTKTATLKFYSQSINSSELISGFLLTVVLPVGSTLSADSITGFPLSSAVYLSGQYTGNSPQISTYDSVLRTLTVNYISTNDYNLGEFMTVIINVPINYLLNTSDIKTSFGAWNSSGLGPLETVTTTFTFN